MQLILPQSELEQAIKNYVNDLMNVKDGTELSIDLKAGRGLDGFTATVDIIKAGTAMPAKTVVPAAVISAPVPVAAPKKNQWLKKSLLKTHLWPTKASSKKLLVRPKKKLQPKLPLLCVVPYLVV